MTTTDTCSHYYHYYRSENEPCETYGSTDDFGCLVEGYAEDGLRLIKIPCRVHPNGHTSPLEMCECGNLWLHCDPAHESMTEDTRSKARVFAFDTATVVEFI